MRVVCEDRWYHESNLVLCVYTHRTRFFARISRAYGEQRELGMRSITSLLIHGMSRNYEKMERNGNNGNL